MEKIIEELRAQVAGLEAKLTDLDSRHGKTASDVKAIAELKAEFQGAIEALRAEIATKEAALQEKRKKEMAPPRGQERPGLFGDADIDPLFQDGVRGDHAE